MTYDVVIPSAGRPTLRRLLAALAAGAGPHPESVVVVDDRPDGGLPRDGDGALRIDARDGSRRAAVGEPVGAGLPFAVVRGPAPGPAAARNAGLRAGRAAWVVFLDDDVEPERDWRAALAADLAGTGDDVAGVQGRIVVPLPAGRRPTDWERNTAGLEHARWATADMAYRRDAQPEIGVLAIGAREALVEAAHGLQRGAPVGHVGRRPSGVLEPRGVELPVRRAATGGERHDDPPLHAGHVVTGAREVGGQRRAPVALGLHVVIEEDDPRRPAGMPARSRQRGPCSARMSTSSALPACLSSDTRAGAGRTGWRTIRCPVTIGQPAPVTRSPRSASSR